VLLALSLVSCRGLWILADDSATGLVAFEAWTDAESFGLNAGLAPALKRTLAYRKLAEISRIGVVTGPGAFTGLRIACSFAQGLARASNASLFSIPTYDLVGKPFFMPLQHQKARTMERDAAVTSGMEFLALTGAGREDSTVRAPAAAEAVVGLAPDPFWPTPEALLAAARKNLGGEPGLRLVYGLEPKISGKR
jgi:hypothetical protein